MADLPARRDADVADEPIGTDYLVVGAGGTGLAFVDSLLDAGDARVVLVDRRDRVGGHWNDAYPFVRLHQPSAWYGVASRPLPEGDADDADDRGASGADVSAYFERLLRERLLPSGRVRWMPASEWRRDADGTHRVRALASGDERVVLARRVVDATLTRTEVPATHPPRYAVAPGVRCVPPNALPHVARTAARFTVVGAGKTGMDACLWLLDQGVPGARIRWIVPRDAWLLDRANMRAGAPHHVRGLRALVAQYAALAEERTVSALFARLEAAGAVIRLDPAVEPTKTRGAIASRAELARLRTIGEIVRLGRVVAVESTRLVLERGELPAEPDTIYVDCSASAVRTPASMPVFEGDVIRLLMLSWGQPLFSAALIAHVEATVADVATKNALCGPVPFPELTSDWPAAWAATLANAAHRRAHPAVHAWVRRCRLQVMSILLRGVRPDDPEARALLKELGAAAAAAAARLASPTAFA